MIFLEIDKTDTAILRVLGENARLSLRKIAKKTGFSVATVMHRIKKLEDSGAIKKYTPVLDADKLGFELQAIIDLRVSKGKLMEVEKKVAGHPNVCAVYDVTGAFDAVIIAKFRNRKGLDAFVKKIQKYDFVERTETKIILNTIKEEQIMV